MQLLENLKYAVKSRNHQVWQHKIHVKYVLTISKLFFPEIEECYAVTDHNNL
jgi:hypothetical protein